MCTAIHMSTQTISQKDLQEKVLDEQKKIDESIQTMFEKLNKDSNLLNDLIREKFGNKEISFMDYIEGFTSVYNTFINNAKLEDLKDQHDYVLGEVFSNSALGDLLFSRLNEKS